MNLSNASKQQLFKVIKWIFVTISTTLLGALATAFLVPRFGKLLSKKSTLYGSFYMERTGYPDCSSIQIDLAPSDKIKTVNIEFQFNREIHDTQLQSGLDLGPIISDGGVAMHGGSSTVPPCNFPGTSADPNPALTFKLNQDRTKILIKGTNPTRFEAQTFLATLYPNPPDSGFRVDVHGEATYEAFGHEFPAAVDLIERKTGKVFHLGNVIRPGEHTSIPLGKATDGPPNSFN